MKIFLVIEVLMVILTYFISNNLFAAAIAAFIVMVGHTIDNENPIAKAFGLFSVATFSGFLYLLGAYAGKLVEWIPFKDDSNGDISDLEQMAEALSAGATPPFNITDDPFTDIAIFVFGFAIVETIFMLIIRLRTFARLV